MVQTTSKFVAKSALGLLLAFAPTMALADASRLDGGSGIGGAATPGLIYQALDVPVFDLEFKDIKTGDPRTGVQVSEKDVDGFFCRSTSFVVPVVSNPKINYACFVQLDLSNARAKHLFKSLRDKPTRVIYTLNGNPRTGVDVFEKSKGDLICQSVIPTTPHPKAEFKCYRDINSIL